MALLILAFALWWQCCTPPTTLQPSAPQSAADAQDIPEAKPAPSPNIDRRARSGGCNNTHCRFAKLALAALLVLWLPTALVPRRPIFRLHLSLLHPEAPPPYPTPHPNGRRITMLALRLTRPKLWQHFDPAEHTGRHLTAPNGEPGVTPTADLLRHCVRLLRYVCLSRLTEQPQPAIVITATERAANAFKLTVYAHYVQLRTYLMLVFGALAYGLFLGFDPLSRNIAIILGVGWLAWSITYSLTRVRRFAQWLHHTETTDWPPAYELHTTHRSWRYIRPDLFVHSGETEIGVGHDRLLAISVTVLFALYLTILDLI
jgi:hypothetical protein